MNSNIPIWLTFLAVGIGSGLGGILRFWISAQMQLRLGDAFPWGTLLVNVAGSFLIGLLVSLTEPLHEAEAVAGSRFRYWHELGLPMAVTGFCGGFTTFSSFSLQTLTLLQDQRYTAAGLNMSLSLALCLGAAFLGWILGRGLRG
jgi:CrcB protein